jgi:hypothetical protein
MVLDRPTADIAYAIARGHGGSTVLLDSLKVGPDVRVTTDALGAFQFPHLDVGTYQIRVLVGAGQTLTAPASGTRTVSLDANGQVGNADFGVWPAGSPWQNSLNPHDVNDDGFVTPLDALQILNKLNEGGARALLPTDGYSPYVDASGDGTLAPGDVLLVINEINRQAPSRAGYSGFAASGGGPGAAEGEASLRWNMRQPLPGETRSHAVEQRSAAAPAEWIQRPDGRAGLATNAHLAERPQWVTADRLSALEDVLEERNARAADLLLGAKTILGLRPGANAAGYAGGQCSRL